MDFLFLDLLWTATAPSIFGWEMLRVYVGRGMLHGCCWCFVCVFIPFEGLVCVRGEMVVCRFNLWLVFWRISWFFLSFLTYSSCCFIFTIIIIMLCFILLLLLLVTLINIIFKVTLLSFHVIIILPFYIHFI